MSGRSEWRMERIDEVNGFGYKILGFEETEQIKSYVLNLQVLNLQVLSLEVLSLEVMSHEVMSLEVLSHEVLSLSR